MKYPSRNSGDLPRRSSSPSMTTALKLKADMHLLKINSTTYLIMLLAGGVSINRDQNQILPLQFLTISISYKAWPSNFEFKC